MTADGIVDSKNNKSNVQAGNNVDSKAPGSGTRPGDESQSDRAPSQPGDESQLGSASSRPGDESQSDRAPSQPSDESQLGSASSRPGDGTQLGSASSRPGDGTQSDRAPSQPSDGTKSEDSQIIKLEGLKADFQNDVECVQSARSLEALNNVRVKYLGKKGVVSGLLSNIGKLPPSERQAYGAAINTVKNQITTEIDNLKTTLEREVLEAELKSERVDVTLPSRGLGIGCIHPLSKVIADIRCILEGLGFTLTQGPEIEDDWHNFTALNIPDLHPARQMHDTFYISHTNNGHLDEGAGRIAARNAGVRSASINDDANEGFKISSAAAGNSVSHSLMNSEAQKGEITSTEKGAVEVPEKPMDISKLLRTHTSNVQIRYMSCNNPPHRIYSVGKVYRSDYDATHTPMFHQAEGLLIDEGITLGHLRWCLETFLQEFFEVPQAPIRFRPSYFPFTEPSYEVDVRCDRSKRGEIKIGTGSDWLEILGCGMVHRNVLENVGVDTDKFQGFAFGIGVERLAMLKYGISDLRSFFHGDVRWLSHYGFNSI